MRKDLDSGVLHAMRALVRVVDTGSFTAAAGQMSLTTAQVSRLVSALEKRLQVQLMQRTTRRLALTDAGAAYVERCREVLALFDQAEAHAAGSAAVPSGRLRVQSMANFGQHYLAPMLPEFCAKHPQLVVEYSTSQYLPDLLASGVDVSVYLAEHLLDSGLIARRIGTTFSILCAAPAYLGKRGIPRKPEQLQDHACLRLVNPSIRPDWHLTTGKGVTHVIRNIGQLIADTPELLQDAAQRGAGITLLPLFSVIDAVRAGRLQRVLPKWRSPEIGVYALLPSRHFMDAKTRAWLEWMEARISPRLVEDAAYFA